MTKKTRVNIPIPSNIKKEIKFRFELGENLKHLAFEYKVNYKTLKNLSSSEKWVKGSKKGLYSVLSFLNETEEDTKSREQSDKYLKYTTLHLQSYAYDLSKNKQEPTNKNQEEAFLSRVKAVVELEKLAKGVFMKRDGKEELEFRKAYMEYEDLLERYEEKEGEERTYHVK